MSTAIATPATLAEEAHLKIVPGEVPILNIRNLNVHSSSAQILKNINLNVQKIVLPYY